MMNLNRRSFLKGSSLSIATFVFGTVVNPLPALSGIMKQKNALDGIKIHSGVITAPEGVHLVETLKAEKAFLLGFKRLSHKYAKRLNFIDVTPIEMGDGGYNFLGTVGYGNDRCTIGFQTNSLIAVDFEYMEHITKQVYSGVHAFFSMSKRERLIGRGMASPGTEVAELLKYQ